MFHLLKVFLKGFLRTLSNVCDGKIASNKKGFFKVSLGKQLHQRCLIGSQIGFCYQSKIRFLIFFIFLTLHL